MVKLIGETHSDTGQSMIQPKHKILPEALVKMSNKHRSKPIALRKAYEIDPAKVIPLDDADLKDF